MLTCLPSRLRQLPDAWKKASEDALGNAGTLPDHGFSSAWLAYCSYLTVPSGSVATHRLRLASFLSKLIAHPPRHERLLDLSYCADLTSNDFAAVAHVLKDSSLFSGLCVVDIPLNDSLSALAECGKLSSTLESVTLSGVLNQWIRRPAMHTLIDGLAAGAAAALPISHLDLSYNDIQVDSKKPQLLTRSHRNRSGYRIGACWVWPCS